MRFTTQAHLENDPNIQYIQVPSATQRIVKNLGDKTVVVEYAVDVESAIEAYLREHGYSTGGALTANPGQMDFATGDNIEILKGTLDVGNQRVFC